MQRKADRQMTQAPTLTPEQEKRAVESYRQELELTELMKA
jgi:hypothetical protein